MNAIDIIRQINSINNTCFIYRSSLLEQMPLIESSRSKNILQEPVNGESLLNGISEDSQRDVQIENKKNLQEVYYMKQIYVLSP